MSNFILNKILGQEVTASYTRDQIARMLTRISADIEKPEMDVITGMFYHLFFEFINN